jgi:hypothetical protein
MINGVERPNGTSRRSLLLGSCAVAAGIWGLRYGIPRVGELFAADFEFTAMSQPIGLIDGGESTAGFDPDVRDANADDAQRCGG